MRKSTLKTPQSVKEGVLHISDIDIPPCDVTTCPRPALGRPSEQWTVKWRVSNRGTKAAPNLSLRLTGSRLKAPHILIKIQSYRAGGVFWQRNCPPPVPLFWYYMLSLSPLSYPSPYQRDTRVLVMKGFLCHVWRIIFRRTFRQKRAIFVNNELVDFFYCLIKNERKSCF